LRGHRVQKGPVAEWKQKYVTEVAARYGIEPISTALFGGVLDFEQYSFVVKAIMHNAKRAIEERGADPGKPYDFRNWVRDKGMGKVPGLRMISVPNPYFFFGSDERLMNPKTVRSGSNLLMVSVSPEYFPAWYRSFHLPSLTPW